MSLRICVLVALCAPASAQDQAQIAAGEAVYEEHCAMCHGEKLRDPGSFPDLRELRAGDRARFDQIVMEGRSQMPAWRGVLNQQNLDQVWAYIRARVY